MAKRKEESGPPGSPAWMSTFSDLMNLLLCFFVMLFSMSTVSEDKWKAMADAMSQTFSIFSSGSTAIGDGVLISNGVSQLNELDKYINSTGKTADSDVDSDEVDEYQQMLAAMEKAELEMSEALAEKIEEAIDEANMESDITVDFTSQYVLLTLNGALLFDSGEVQLKNEAYPVLNKVGAILEKYAEDLVQIEGHTDTVPQHGTKYSNNDELSDGRALSVFNYLIETTALDPAMVMHAGRGEYVPVADNSTEEGRAKNRRVEIRIYRSNGIRHH